MFTTTNLASIPIKFQKTVSHHTIYPGLWRWVSVWRTTSVTMAITLAYLLRKFTTASKWLLCAQDPKKHTARLISRVKSVVSILNQFQFLPNFNKVSELWITTMMMPKFGIAWKRDGWRAIGTVNGLLHVLLSQLFLRYVLSREKCRIWFDMCPFFMMTGSFQKGKGLV